MRTYCLLRSVIFFNTACWDRPGGTVSSCPLPAAPGAPARGGHRHNFSMMTTGKGGKAKPEGAIERSDGGLVFEPGRKRVAVRCCSVTVVETSGLYKSLLGAARGRNGSEELNSRSDSSPALTSIARLMERKASSQGRPQRASVYCNNPPRSWRAWTALCSSSQGSRPCDAARQRDAQHGCLCPPTHTPGDS